VVSFFSLTPGKFDATARVGYSEYAGWSSLVARRAHNPKVVSSNLTPATILIQENKRLAELHSKPFFWNTPIVYELCMKYRFSPSLTAWK
jgi:hypothetical protein